jgi:hypothetical protein
MAYLNQEDDEQTQGQGLNQTLGAQQGQQPQPQDGSVSQQPSAQPSTIGQGTNPSATPSQPQSQPKAPGSGSFTNLKSYLQANQGNRLASTAAQRVERTGQQAQKSINQAQNVFGNRLEAGSLQNRDTALTDVQNTINAATNLTYQPPVQASIQPTGQGATTPPPPTQGQSQPNVPEGQTQPNYFTADQEARFADVINAAYQGPNNLQEAGVYNPVVSRVRAAKEMDMLSQSAAGRQQLLRNLLSQNRDYTRGQSNLDAAILNTSEGGVKQVQQAGKEAGQAQNQFEMAQNVSRNLADQRRQEISGIKSKAQELFNTGQKDELAKTKKRLDDMLIEPMRDESGNPIPKLDASGKQVLNPDGTPAYQTQWDALPEYFKGVLNNATSLSAKDDSPAIKAERKRLEDLKKRTSGKAAQEIQQQIDNLNKRATLSAEEAAALGLNVGESLFGLGSGLVYTGQSDREKLVSKDEVSRQLALARLAGLDKSSILSTNTDFSNLDKAGTQSILDSLDLERTRNRLNEANANFDSMAKGKFFASNTGAPVSLAEKMSWSGYKPFEASEYQAPTTLADIARGGEYVSGAKIASAAGEDLGARQSGTWRTNYGGSNNQDLINTMNRSGIYNKVQTSDSEASRLRSEALRRLLGNIDKTNT